MSYVLDEGNYVLIDPVLQKSLQVVRDISRNPFRKERSRFINNPERYLEDNDPELLKTFIETPEYSARVEGQGFWVDQT